RMEGVLDVQADHVPTIHYALRALAEGGTLFVSNNLCSFTLDYKALSSYEIEDISAQTIDQDFDRNARIRQCWLIRRYSDDHVHTVRWNIYRMIDYQQRLQ